MFNIILEITKNTGIKIKERVTTEDPVDQDELDYWERYYTDTYSYPDNVNAVVVNVFEVED